MILKTLILINILNLSSVACADIPTNILLQPAKILHDKYYVPTKAQVSAKAEILKDEYKNSNLTYQWSTKTETIITGWNASQISHVFDNPDEGNFLKVLVVQTNDTKNAGSSMKNIAVRDPIVISDPSGKMFIEHGELLDVTLNWSGTGPFRFCHRICQPFEEPCDKCDQHIGTENAYVRIERYLRYVGNYTLLFRVDNLASVSDKRYFMKVASTFRKQKVQYVPIISSISAVLILFFGVALHIKFKKTVDMETADFDFFESAQDEDELLEGDTFCQRVCHLLKKPSTYMP